MENKVCFVCLMVVVGIVSSMRGELFGVTWRTSFTSTINQLVGESFERMHNIKLKNGNEEQPRFI